MNDTIYKIEVDGRLYWETFLKRESALKVARALADSCKFKEIKVIEFMSRTITDVKRKPLYKPLWED